MDSRFSDISLQAVGAARAAERQQLPQQQPVDLRVPIDAPSGFDVLSGRGQGVQRHPGNVKYRRLVFLNKGLYAGCPSVDKAKISRGIVAAVREFGGRFLELDEQTGTYRDIGDKKAWDKTSKALREGQKMIRHKLHGNTASDDVDTSPLCSSRGRAGAVRAAGGYLGYSVQALESLCKFHEGVPSQAPPSRRLQDPSPVRAPQIAPSPDTLIGDSVERVRGVPAQPHCRLPAGGSPEDFDGDALAAAVEEELLLEANANILRLRALLALRCYYLARMHGAPQVRRHAEALALCFGGGGGLFGMLSMMAGIDGAANGFDGEMFAAGHDDEEDNDDMVFRLGGSNNLVEDDGESECAPEEQRRAMLDRLDDMLVVPPEYEIVSPEDGQFEDAEEDDEVNEIL